MREWKDALRTPSKPPHFEPLVASLRKANAEIDAERHAAERERDAAQCAAEELRNALASVEIQQQQLEFRAARAEAEAFKTSIDAVEVAGVKLENHL